MTDELRYMLIMKLEELENSNKNPKLAENIRNLIKLDKKGNFSCK